MVQPRKKQWARPQVQSISLEQAGAKIQQALELLEGDSQLRAECDDLRSILREIDGTAGGK